MGEPVGLVERVALVRGQDVVICPSPESDQLANQLKLFLNSSDFPADLTGCSESVAFVLTNESGHQLYVYTLVFSCHADEDQSAEAADSCALCLLSQLRCHTPFRAVLDWLVRTACLPVAGPGDCQPQLQVALETLLQVQAPTPRIELRLEFCCNESSDSQGPKAGAVFAGCQPGHPPPADEALWDLLQCLGVQNVTRLWHALLLEQLVLLISDTVPLLFVACEALLTLLHPMRWEHTYVPFLPRALVSMVEAPSPFLMATQRQSLDAACSLDTSDGRPPPPAHLHQP